MQHPIRERLLPARVTRSLSSLQPPEKVTPERQHSVAGTTDQPALGPPQRPPGFPRAFAQNPAPRSGVPRLRTEPTPGSWERAGEKQTARDGDAGTRREPPAGLGALEREGTSQSEAPRGGGPGGGPVWREPWGKGSSSHPRVTDGPEAPSEGNWDRNPPHSLCNLSVRI